MDRSGEPGQLVAIGRTAEVFAWGDERILKLFRPEMPERLPEAELLAARTVEKAGLPAPRLFEEVAVDGRVGLVYERLVGPSMVDELARRPTAVSNLARTLARLNVRMHATTGTDLPDLKERLRGMIGAAGLPDELASAALDRLDRMPSGDSLLHGDMHPGNVIMCAGGPRIIDWMTAARGDPAVDVARTLFLLRDSNVPGASGIQRLALGIGRPIFARAYLAEYHRQTGLDLARVRAWRPVVLAARYAEGIEAERPRIMRELRQTLAP